MKLITFLIAFTISTYSFGSGDHGHSHGPNGEHTHVMMRVSKDKVVEISKKNIIRLIKAKRLESSWSNAKLDSAEKKTFNNVAEWLVTYKNDKGIKGKKLYIFLTLSGDFVAANFTGK